MGRPHAGRAGAEEQGRGGGPGGGGTGCPCLSSLPRQPVEGGAERAAGAGGGEAENQGCPGGIYTQQENALRPLPAPYSVRSLLPQYCWGVRSSELKLHSFPLSKQLMNSFLYLFSALDQLPSSTNAPGLSSGVVVTGQEVGSPSARWGSGSWA